MEMILRQVGVVKNSVKKPIHTPGKETLIEQKEVDILKEKIKELRRETSKIIIDEDLEGVLDGIEDFSHIMVFFWGHKIEKNGRSLTKLRPMRRKDLPLVGLYCTCSPARPNPVLMTVVRLLERNGNILKVTGLDAIDGSPVVDIKPYVKESYPQEDVVAPEWMQRILDEKG